MEFSVHLQNNIKKMSNALLGKLLKCLSGAGVYSEMGCLSTVCKASASIPSFQQTSYNQHILSVFYVCSMCVYACVHSCGHIVAHEPVGQRLTLGIFLITLYLSFETRSLNEPGAHCIVQINQPSHSRNPSVSTAPALGLQEHATTPSFLIGAGNPNLGCHVLHGKHFAD